MKRWVILLVFLLLVGALTGAYFWYKNAGTPLRESGEEKLVEIPSGASTREVGAKLVQEGLVRSELVFLIAERVSGNLIQAGVYRLSPAMSLDAIVTTLAEGKVAEYILTIPEGWRVREIAQLLSEKKMLAKEEFLSLAIPKEGYLFPDTYHFPLTVTPNEIITAMRENFDTRTNDASLHLKRTDIILASIVEREAKNDEERPKIAAVYLNRLEQGMRLEADPTVQYAKTLVDSSISDPWPKITVDDYRSVNSPYNTYVNDGLPPGPICNPGLASLKAVLSPASTQDLYFFHTSDGQTIFSKTLEEHNAKKLQYNLAI